MRKRTKILLLTGLLCCCALWSLAACTGGNPTPSQKPNEPPQEHVHVWGEWVTDLPATCTTQGNQHRTCTLDASHNEYLSIPVDPNAHDYQWQLIIGATCTETGVRKQVCPRDGSEGDTEEIAALGHDYVWQTVTAATCTETGVRKQVCSHDGSEGAIEIIAALGHDYQWRTTVYATCEEDGRETLICQHAEHEYTDTEWRPIGALGHNYVWQTVTAATCTETGVRKQVCSHDGSEGETGEIAALGHNYVWQTVTAATCTETGVRKQVCSHDGSEGDTEEIAALGHSYSWQVTVAPTCTAAGERQLICVHDHTTVSGDPETVAALGHNFVWVQLTAATDKLPATGKYVCSHDGYSDNIVHYSATALTLGQDSASQIAAGAFRWYSLVLTEPTVVSLTVTRTAGTGYVFAYLYSESNFNKYLASVYDGGPQYRVYYNYSFHEIYYAPYAILAAGTYFVKLNSTGINTPTATLRAAAVTNISDGMFYGRTDLTAITIPDGVTSISNSAFNGCANMTSITVGADNLYYATQDGILYNKTKTVIIFVPRGISGSVTIPDSVTSIAEGAFYDCTGLTSIIIGHGVASIGSNAFGGCTGLTNITIPDNVTSIDANAFNELWSLAIITVSADNLTYASQDGILYNKAKTAIIYVPRGISGSVTIPDGVMNIADYAFNRCIALTGIIIGHGVASIASNAFWGCTGLTNITIPDNVTSIGANAFNGCYNLTGITVGAGNQNYASQDGILYNKAKTAIIYVPEGISGSVIIPEGVTSIDQEAFNGCGNLTGIIIPEGVTSIGLGAFQACDNLTIYVKAASQPAGWASNWNSSDRPVVWGYTGD
jgi:hypothetical protein